MGYTLEHKTPYRMELFPALFGPETALYRVIPDVLGVAPGWVTLFEPCLPGFARIRRLTREDLVAVLELERRLQRDAVDRLVQHLFRQPQSHRARLADDTFRNGHGGRDQLVGRDDAGDEPHFFRFVRIDDSTGVQHV